MSVGVRTDARGGIHPCPYCGSDIVWAVNTGDWYAGVMRRSYDPHQCRPPVSPDPTEYVPVGGAPRRPATAIRMQQQATVNLKPIGETLDL